MATPAERLLKITNNFRPTVVKFTAETTGNKHQVTFLTSIVSKAELLPNEDKLQSAISSLVNESWDNDLGEYKLMATVDSLYDNVKRAILRQYQADSNRCNATKRKTEMFVHSIQITQQHLANFLLELYVELQSESFSKMPREQRRVRLETLESLRRVYGKHR